MDTLYCKCCTPPYLYKSPVFLSDCNHICCRETVVCFNDVYICPLCNIENDSIEDENDDVTELLDNIGKYLSDNECFLHSLPYTHVCLDHCVLMCKDCIEDHEYKCSLQAEKIDIKVQKKILLTKVTSDLIKANALLDQMYDNYVMCSNQLQQQQHEDEGLTKFLECLYKKDSIESRKALLKEIVDLLQAKAKEKIGQNYVAFRYFTNFTSSLESIRQRKLFLFDTQLKLYITQCLTSSPSFFEKIDSICCVLVANDSELVASKKVYEVAAKMVFGPIEEVSNNYVYFKSTTMHRDKIIVLACPSANTMFGEFALHLLRDFKPSLAVLVGSCSGKRGEQILCDLLIATDIVECGEWSRENKEFLEWLEKIKMNYSHTDIEEYLVPILSQSLTEEYVIQWLSRLIYESETNPDGSDWLKSINFTKTPGGISKNPAVLEFIPPNLKPLVLLQNMRNTKLITPDNKPSEKMKTDIESALELYGEYPIPLNTFLNPHIYYGTFKNGEYATFIQDTTEEIAIDSETHEFYLVTQLLGIDSISIKGISQHADSESFKEIFFPYKQYCVLLSTLFSLKIIKSHSSFQKKKSPGASSIASSLNSSLGSSLTSSLTSSIGSNLVASYDPTQTTTTTTIRTISNNQTKFEPMIVEQQNIKTPSPPTGSNILRDAKIDPSILTPKKEESLLESPTTTTEPKDQSIKGVFVMGGIGKSTILNSILGLLEFKSGISLDFNTKLYKTEKDYITYFECPYDIELLQDQDKIDLFNFLQTHKYKLLFVVNDSNEQTVVDLMNGSMNPYLNQNNYGILYNNLESTDKIRQLINENDPKLKPNSLTIPFMSSIADLDNKLMDKQPTDCLVQFINSTLDYQFTRVGNSTIKFGLDKPSPPVLFTTTTIEESKIVSEEFEQNEIYLYAPIPIVKKVKITQELNSTSVFQVFKYNDGDGEKTTRQLYEVKVEPISGSEKREILSEEIMK
ncbi:hypothetical protein CYY_003543 [Polysphondylium violaceum]|uniref:Uncharacterized protein n=1 Tax=Polysphondylium violaceum TaxID=133409 RepID=A0A8J4PUK4_9MYCE|nr:hypothetical protein CYY_003543 [Polysphondylium violaceum]